ncbi:unnamed protein product [Auanema sp. JU1783]|nr:unnamed protein product [Auanema sp. JU1783]
MSGINIIYLFSDLPGPIPADETIMDEMEDLNLGSTYRIVYRCRGGNPDSGEPQLFLDREGRPYFLTHLPFLGSAGAR